MHEISATTMTLNLFQKEAVELYPLLTSEVAVTVKVDALKKRADVISYLEKYNLPQGGTLPILRYRLRNHLAKVAKKARHLKPCSVTASTCQTISYPFCQSGYFVVCH